MVVWGNESSLVPSTSSNHSSRLLFLFLCFLFSVYRHCVVGLIHFVIFSHVAHNCCPGHSSWYWRRRCSCFFFCCSCYCFILAIINIIATATEKKLTTKTKKCENGKRRVTYSQTGRGLAKNYRKKCKKNAKKWK